MTPIQFGQWVARERAALGLTQKELADRLGWTPTAVSEVERARDGRDVTLGRVAKICRALGKKSFAFEL